VNVTTSVDCFNDQFTVMTKTKIFLITKPHTSVIPFLRDGRVTMDKGFQVYYSTTDDEILKIFHETICTAVQGGCYPIMLENIKRNQPPIPSPEMMQHITGFKY